MPGKVFKLIGKTLHPDGYYTASILSTSDEATTTSEAEAVATPKIKLCFRFDKNKGSRIIEPEQRDEKLMKQEQEQAAAAVVAKEEIPTPGVVLLVEESVEVKTTTAVVSTHHHAVSTSPLSDDYSTFQSKLDATKRKMHDSYQQRANAKKQRMIQVIDPHDIPPQPLLKGKGIAVAARKKMITAKTKTRNNNNNNNNNFFDDQLLSFKAASAEKEIN